MAKASRPAAAAAASIYRVCTFPSLSSPVQLQSIFSLEKLEVQVDRSKTHFDCRLRRRRRSWRSPPSYHFANGPTHSHVHQTSLDATRLPYLDIHYAAEPMKWTEPAKEISHSTRLKMVRTYTHCSVTEKKRYFCEA